MIPNGTPVRINKNCARQSVVGKEGVVVRFVEEDPYVREDHYEVMINTTLHLFVEEYLDIIHDMESEGYKRVSQSVGDLTFDCLVKDDGTLKESDIPTIKKNLLEFFNKHINTSEGSPPPPIKAKEDIIDHPRHYNMGKIEPIDVIEDWKLPYHLGNSIKYIARAGKKDPSKEIEDLKKSVWHINRYIKKLEGEIK